jgi:flagellar biosynthesis/type III secretory pathway protein FliH
MSRKHHRALIEAREEIEQASQKAYNDGYKRGMKDAYKKLMLLIRDYETMKKGAK